MPERMISCSHCFNALGEVQSWKAKYEAQLVRADEAAQDVREAERALKAAASAHATTLEELRVAHSDRTAALIRTCSVETELLQQTLSELQAHKVDQTAKLSPVQEFLGRRSGRCFREVWRQCK